MTSKYNCENCKKNFSTKGALKIHIETVCNRSEDTIFNCTFCDSNLSCKSALYKHLKTCQGKKDYEVKQQEQIVLKQLEDAKNIIKQKDLEFELLKEDHKQKIQDLTSQHEQQIKQQLQFRENNAQAIESMKEAIIDRDKKNEYLRGKIKVLQEQLDKQQQQLDKLQQKPTYINTFNNNNTINNNLYIQNLEPITDELIRETGSKIGMMDLKDGAPGIMRKFQPILKNRVICTDATRNSLMYNYNGQLKRDTRGQMLTDKIITSTEPQLIKYKEEIDNYYKSLNQLNLTDDQRAQNDTHFDNYQELCRAIKRKTEFSKKKISRNISKIIAVFSKSKTQFESHVLQQYENQEHDGLLNSSIQPVFGHNDSSENVVQELSTERDEGKSQSVESVNYIAPVDQRAKYNKVVSTKQTLINGKVFELHLDDHGNIVRKFRLRSSGLPYLTDEETDPESREQSDQEEDEDFDLGIEIPVFGSKS